MAPGLKIIIKKNKNILIDSDEMNYALLNLLSNLYQMFRDLVEQIQTEFIVYLLIIYRKTKKIKFCFSI